MFTAACTVPAGRNVLIQDAGVGEVRRRLGEAGGMHELVADTTLHQPRRPVVIVRNVAGPFVRRVTHTTNLTRCLARQHRLQCTTAASATQHSQQLTLLTHPFNGPFPGLPG